MLPISRYEPGEMVIAAGATTGKLLLLRQGVVEVVRDGTQIARISEPGSIFGELAILLDKPHTADVRAVERSEFHVADAAALLASDPAATLYIAAILAARLDAANVALIEIKRQLETGNSRVAIARSVDKIADLLISGAGNLVYAGYPDPFTSPPECGAANASASGIFWCVGHGRDGRFRRRSGGRTAAPDWQPPSVVDNHASAFGSGFARPSDFRKTHSGAEDLRGCCRVITDRASRPVNEGQIVDTAPTGFVLYRSAV